MICPSCKSENDPAAEACFKCGLSLYALTQGALMAGRYEVRRLLGQGGMGVVYECYDTTLEEPVALKVLRADLAAKPDVARRFRSEIKLARRVRHRNVCGIHEYGEEGSVSFIVMELVEGQDLRHVLRERGALPKDVAFDIAAQVADGLEAIHRAGIIHRDLKAPNLMRSADGTVRLMDFGIAKQFGAGATAATATGQVLGTAEYMSPEQGRGDKIDHRTDIYSLGVLIFELFTGRVPFHGDTPLATIFKHLQEPPPLDDAGLAATPSLVPILRRALAKDPKDRQSSAAELAAELRVAAGQVPAPGEATDHAQPDDSRTRPIHPPRLERHVVEAPTPDEAPVEPVPRLRPNAPSRRAVRLVVGLGLGLALTVVVGVSLTIRAWQERIAGSRGVVPADESEAAPVPQPTATPLPATTATPPTSATRPSAKPTPRVSRVPATTVPRPTRPPTPTPQVSRVPATTVPRPTRPPTPTPQVSRVPAITVPKPTRPPAPTPSFGMLEVLVRPWAEVIIDGESRGTTPLRPLRLSVGAHEVELRHPRYEPLRKRVVVGGEGLVKLKVDLASEALPKTGPEQTAAPRQGRVRSASAAAEDGRALPSDR